MQEIVNDVIGSNTDARVPYARIALVRVKEWCSFLFLSASALSLGRFQAASLLSSAMLFRAGGRRVGEPWDF